MQFRYNARPRLRVLSLAVIFVAASAIGSDARGEEKRPLLARYRGAMKCPDGLYVAHARFAKAMKAGKADAIRACCLPAAIRVNEQLRKKHVEYGPAINIPFAKTRFTPEILGLRDEGSECVLVRTGTSYLRYVKTAKQVWRLYDYGDKPIK
ncbi:MAG: hypothetical protein ACYTGZ_20910 [Planctomycetota bacterium]|jgi:hypothetical protein